MNSVKIWFELNILRRWPCGDCGFINRRRVQWCQDPSCRAMREDWIVTHG